ncbi:MAG TPA: APC family permease [Actinomycetota bacterium]|nr:APC family permease [Actinomycetota bacterium]
MATNTRPGASSSTGGVLKRLLVGRALATHKQEHQLLPKILALPVFASDALSSTAYATEEMMLVLVVAGAAALAYAIPISVAIACLLAIVITSYRQTVRAYPRGGGSYIVARENLGLVPGLIAAAAILTDYVLTVAVSMTAGTIAITSALPSLATHKVALAISLTVLITLVNLRGVKEAGTFFAFPTYGFVLMVGVTLASGFAECLSGCPLAETSTQTIEAESALAAFLILRAFSSGATALTGVEAVADGVQAFRRPQARNAASTLSVMGTLLISMFLGITVLASLLHVRVTHDIAESKSVLAQIGETVFGAGSLLFYLLQIFTAGILILAANTSFQDFPRLSSILARDRFMPSQFRNRGDRLVFSNGVVVLSALACVLIYAFDANLTRLIQLYVVGVFTAFTLSQSGMVRRWFRVKGPRWKRSVTINAVGAVTTGVVLVIVTVTKWQGGARLVVAAIPVIVGFFLAVHHHYERVGKILRVRRLSPRVEPRNTFLVLVEDVGPALLDAVRYLRVLRPEDVMPLYVGPPDRFEQAKLAWAEVGQRLGGLELLPRAEDHLTRSVRAHIRSLAREPGDFVTVMIPEAFASSSWLQFVRRRRELLLKGGLLFEPGVVVTDVPLLPGEPARERDRAHPTEVLRHVALVPVSAVHDASVRAVVYGKSLRPALVEGLFFVTDPGEIHEAIEAWHQREMDIPLVLVEAPFRDFAIPLLEEIRKHTVRGDTIVTVVLPELIPAHWWENLLHNQTAFAFKRQLLFEPGVVVTSVPFHLRTAAVEVPDPSPA